MRRLIGYLKLLTVLAVMLLIAGLLGYFASIEIAGKARVLDGDSLLVDGREIRLLGIDAPEYRQSCAKNNSVNGSYPCGRMAAEHLKRLIGDGDVLCTGSAEDKFGRLLAICQVQSRELNASMVRDGWAVAFGAYEGLEAEAIEKSSGLWNGNFERPSSWRRKDLEKRHKGFLSEVFGW